MRIQTIRISPFADITALTSQFAWLDLISNDHRYWALYFDTFQAWVTAAIEGFLFLLLCLWAKFQSLLRSYDQQFILVSYSKSLCVWLRSMFVVSSIVNIN